MLIPLIRKFGGTIGSATKAGAAGARHGLEDTSLHAPSPALVLTALRVWENTAGNVPTHDDFVQALAAIKAALGPDAADHYGAVEDWALAYDGNDADYVRKTWDSITDAAIGWDWLAGKARAAGFTDDAQTDFAEKIGPEWTASQPKSATTKKLRAQLLSEVATWADPNELVQRFFVHGQMSVLVAPPGTAKTFFILSVGMHIALGLPFHGLRVDGGVAVYIAGEGSGGLKRRIQAIACQLGEDKIASAPFAVIAETVNFRDKASVDQLIAALADLAARLGLPIKLVIVDTLSRALAGGDENAPADMGAAVGGVDRVRAATGAHVCLLHHTGKDESRGARGHSLLLGAVDTELKIERVEGDKNVFHVSVTKQRDLELGAGLTFRLKPIGLGNDKWGNAITSCVVEPATRKPKLTEIETEALQILTTLLFEGTETTAANSEWRKAVLSAEDLFSGQSADSRQKAWQRARKGLENKGAIEVFGDRVGVKS